MRRVLADAVDDEDGVVDGGDVRRGLVVGVSGWWSVCGDFGDGAARALDSSTMLLLVA